MRISYVNSVAVPHDAISEAIRDEVNWLRAEGHEVLLFTYECGFPELPAHTVHKVSDVVFNGHFQTSDLVVFHFGVYSELFNTVMLCPAKAKRVVVFHNITPPAVAAPAERSLLQQSLEQVPNAEFADAVFCVSEVNEVVLRQMGVSTPTRVLPIAVHVDIDPPSSKPSHDDGVVRVAFIGRFVRSKGINDLLEAIALVDATQGPRIDVSFLGSTKYSDPGITDCIRSATDDDRGANRSRVTINLLPDATDTVKSTLLSDADILVLPSYHEGFGVPILEAFAKGCRVIAYDNSAMPATSGGLATIVPTGVVEALSDAIDREAVLLQSSGWVETGYGQWASDAVAYVSEFSPETTKSRFLAAVSEVVAYSPAETQ